MKKLINIYGTARCGSTMIDLILGNDPKGFSLGEVDNWFWPWRTHHFDIKCGCGVYPCPVWEKIKNINEKEFHKKIFKILDIDFLVDSSKNLPWIIDNNIRGYKDNEYTALNILIYKNPVSLYYSHWKRGDKKIDTMFNAYNDYAVFFESNLHYVTINYDTLISDGTEKILEQLCHIIEIPFFKDKQKFWNKKHHHLFGSFGTRKQLFQANSSIYKENYSEEFLAIKPEIEEKIHANKKISAIVNQLYSTDIKNFEKYPFPFKKLSIKKSYNFYYKSKLKRYVKRLSPVQYPDKESQLIHTYRF